MTWTSPVLPKLENDDLSDNPLGRKITSEEDGWIASLINIGAIIGPFPYGFLAEALGRKFVLLSIAAPHIIAYFTFAFATNINLYYFGRILGGLAVGGGYTLMPMYIAEIAEDSNRGTLSVTLQIFWGLGNLLPYAIGPYMSIKWFNIALACVPCLFFVVFLLAAPETPYFLVSKNKLEKAEESLMLLRSCNREQARKEVEEIKLTLEKHEDGSIWDIFKTPKLRKAFLISMVLIALNQFSGINAVAFYLQPILDMVQTGISSDLGSTITGVVTFLVGFVAFYFTDRLGRKPLLIFSSFLSSFALVSIGIFFYLQMLTDFDIEKISWVPLFSVIVYTVGFNIGIGALPWIITAELFPNKVKGISATSASCACWTYSFLITKFFNNMTDGIRLPITFWVFAVCCALGGVFCIFFVPETKGKSFNEIQDML